MFMYFLIPIIKYNYKHPISFGQRKIKMQIIRKFKTKIKT